MTKGTAGGDVTGEEGVDTVAAVALVAAVGPVAAVEDDSP